MSEARLIEAATNKGVTLGRVCSVGRAEENTIVVPHRCCSRHHCVIQRCFLGGWRLRQLGGDEAGVARQTATFVRRQKKIHTVLSGQKWKLASGDELAFGRPKGAEEPEFTHIFWVM